jgi:hypothetical protein
LSAILISAAAYLLLNRQHVIDQITVWQYQPTSEVVSLADRSGMNDNGRFLYYASQPTLESTQNFNKECDRLEASTSILGCYTNDHIYIYNVTDPQLDGIREVTAAHEMLHAVYQRMSDSDRSKVDVLLEAEYTKLESDPAFKERMDFYARTEPGERDNELHSVIGTEVANISPELEAHYKQYFSDRQKVTTLATQYKSVFTSLTNQANQIGSQLTALASSIQSRSIAYNNDVQVLNTDIQTFNSRAANNGFSSQAQFNKERASLVAREAALATERTAINDGISQYNTLLDKYNSIAAASKKLYNSIDSTLAPAPSI